MQDKEFDIMEVAEAIVAKAVEAMAARRRHAADLAQCGLDELAFDVATEAFDEEYLRSYRPGSYYDEDDCAELHHDAQLSALEAFLGAYLKEAGR